MAGVIYLLDTNVVSDLLKRNELMVNHLKSHLTDDNAIGICQPVYYETLRGLLWAEASVKETVLQQELLPLFQWVTLTDDDWRLAARYWAQAVSAGRQLADVDLLVAAIATRLGAVVVSADDDFDALPIQRENWRKTAMR